MEEVGCAELSGSEKVRAVNGVCLVVLCVEVGYVQKCELGKWGICAEMRAMEGGGNLYRGKSCDGGDLCRGENCWDKLWMGCRDTLVGNAEVS